MMTKWLSYLGSDELEFTICIVEGLNSIGGSWTVSFAQRQRRIIVLNRTGNYYEEQNILKIRMGLARRKWMKFIWQFFLIIFEQLLGKFVWANMSFIQINKTLELYKHTQCYLNTVEIHYPISSVVSDW